MIYFIFKLILFFISYQILSFILGPTEAWTAAITVALINEIL